VDHRREEEWKEGEWKNVERGEWGVRRESENQRKEYKVKEERDSYFSSVDNMKSFFLLISCTSRL
jgi:hypothetical protein